MVMPKLVLRYLGKDHALELEPGQYVLAVEEDLKLLKETDEGRILITNLGPAPPGAKGSARIVVGEDESITIHSDVIFVLGQRVSGSHELGETPVAVELSPGLVVDVSKTEMPYKIGVNYKSMIEDELVDAALAGTVIASGEKRASISEIAEYISALQASSHMATEVGEKIYDEVMESVARQVTEYEVPMTPGKAPVSRWYRLIVDVAGKHILEHGLYEATPETIQAILSDEDFKSRLETVLRNTIYDTFIYDHKAGAWRRLGEILGKTEKIPTLAEELADKIPESSTFIEAITVAVNDVIKSFKTMRERGDPSRMYATYRHGVRMVGLMMPVLAKLAVTQSPAQAIQALTLVDSEEAPEPIRRIKARINEEKAQRKPEAKEAIEEPVREEVTEEEGAPLELEPA